MSSPNIYEGNSQLDAERERLRSFDIPTQTSIQAIGLLHPDNVILDIGAGENPSLRDYVQDNGAHYVAFDIRKEPLLEHLSHAPAVQGDVRYLPFEKEASDVTHARFVLAHFPNTADRQRIVTDGLRTVKPGGKAVFIDYDWTTLNGSPVMQALRDFTINSINIFDARYGSYSLSEIQESSEEQTVVEALRTTFSLSHDYGPALGLRHVTIAGLQRQGSDDTLIKQAHDIFDALEIEAASDNPPGFCMPDVVAVVVTKPNV